MKMELCNKCIHLVLKYYNDTFSLKKYCPKRAGVFLMEDKKNGQVILNRNHITAIRFCEVLGE